MDALRIFGGTPLSGSVRVSGSKNASLPIMTAALLAKGESVLHNVPDLADVRTLCQVLETLGAKVTRDGHTLRIDASALTAHEAPYELVRTMRASVLVLGPLLARAGKARVSLPGGCAIGARPVDQHLKGLERLGATFNLEHGYIEAHTKGLRGAEVVLDFPTVGGTENVMLAAAGTAGITHIRNAAREPEIVDLALALSSMGAKITGAGTEHLVIEGIDTPRPLQHRVTADRIECGTFLVAGALAGTPLHVTAAVPDDQVVLIDKLRQCGARVEVAGDTISVWKADVLEPVDVQTAPYPGFPTDMQAQMMVLLAHARGTSTLTETIFENRFMHVAELDRLGANIRVDGGRAIVRGVERLSGTIVMATDLRASACLVLAGLVAEGETVVRRIYHLDRGYEHIESKLRSVGAKIERFAEKG